MDKNISDILELNKSPMLAVENFKILAANSPACELLGEKLVGCSPSHLLPDHLFRSRSEKFTCSALVNEKSFIANVHRSGNVIYISLTPVLPPSSSMNYVSDFLMNTLLSELFTLGISVNCIQNEIEFEPDGKVAKHIAVMNHNYFNLRRSLQNLNSAILLMRDEMFINKRLVDLCVLCSELASTLEHIQSATGISIEFSTPHGTLISSMDRDLIERALLNILCNSYAATPSGGKITMRLETSGNTAIISVDDNGSGIPPSVMSNVFTRYAQPLTLESLHMASTGGLGLGIARGIMESHGGAIMIESTEGVGTCVRLLLPMDHTSMRLESESIIPRRSGMDAILTELAPVLENSFYTKKYSAD